MSTSHEHNADTLVTPVDPHDQASRVLATEELANTVIEGRYRLIKPVGRGGMSVLYEAEQMALGRKVAVKILSPPSASGRSTLEQRFLIEAKTAAQLTHPNTIVIYDYGGTSAGFYFIAMEYLHGRSLATAISADGPFAPERAIHIGLQICSSLEDAHQMGLVHRDLKPHNVFLIQVGGDPDHVKVLDFGLVKVLGEGVLGEKLGEEEAVQTRTGAAMGTPAYMPPEQILGRAVDTRADVYSFGALMFHVLTGKLPFQRQTVFELMTAHMRMPVPRLRDAFPACRASGDLEAIIRRCMRKKPSDRFPSMAAVADALRACINTASKPDIAKPRRADSSASLAETEKFHRASVMPSSEAELPSGLHSVDTQELLPPNFATPTSDERVRTPDRQERSASPSLNALREVAKEKELSQGVASKKASADKPELRLTLLAPPQAASSMPKFEPPQLVVMNSQIIRSRQRTPARVQRVAYAITALAMAALALYLVLVLTDFDRTTSADDAQSAATAASAVSSTSGTSGTSGTPGVRGATGSEELRPSDTKAGERAEPSAEGNDKSAVPAGETASLAEGTRADGAGSLDSGKSSNSSNSSDSGDSAKATDKAAPADAALTRAVRISSAPSGAVVYRDGQRVGVTPLVLKLAQGQGATLELAAEGRKKRTVSLRPSDKELYIRLEPVPGAKKGGTKPGAEDDEWPTPSLTGNPSPWKDDE